MAEVKAQVAPKGFSGTVLEVSAASKKLKVKTMKMDPNSNDPFKTTFKEIWVELSTNVISWSAMPLPGADKKQETSKFKTLSDIKVGDLVLIQSDDPNALQPIASSITVMSGFK